MSEKTQTVWDPTAAAVERLSQATLEELTHLVGRRLAGLDNVPAVAQHHGERPEDFLVDYAKGLKGDPRAQFGHAVCNVMQHFWDLSEDYPVRQSAWFSACRLAVEARLPRAVDEFHDDVLDQACGDWRPKVAKLPRWMRDALVELLGKTLDKPEFWERQWNKRHELDLDLSTLMEAAAANCPKRRVRFVEDYLRDYTTDGDTSPLAVRRCARRVADVVQAAPEGSVDATLDRLVRPAAECANDKAVDVLLAEVFGVLHLRQAPENTDWQKEEALFLDRVRRVRANKLVGRAFRQQDNGRDMATINGSGVCCAW